MKRWLAGFAAVAFLSLQGCASVKSADARDPWESMNRSVYNFNDAVDTLAIKPVAQNLCECGPQFCKNRFAQCREQFG